MSRPTYAVDPGHTRHASARGLFGLLAAPAAWIAQGLVGWWMGAGVCSVWSVDSVRTMLGTVGVAALLVALGGLTSSLRAWRARWALEASGDDAAAFLHFAGVFVSTAFAVGIFWAVLNALVITDCGVAR